ncbi:MAG: chorismate-binding protein [bacterium]
MKTALKAIQNNIDADLPFVLFRYPNKETIKGLLQLDDQLHYAPDFSSDGFIFAPYDKNKEVILVPKNSSSSIECNSSDFKTSINKEPIKLELSDSIKKNYLEIIEKAVLAIKNEHFTKVVLSRIQKVEIGAVNCLELFSRIIDKYSNAFCYCWYHPKVGLWLGATPERLLHIKNNTISTVSLAGTLSADKHDEKSWSPKEIKEQQIVTDYIVNALKDFSNTIQVGATETIKVGSLLHLRTLISCTISDTEKCLKDLVYALHPTPAVCGIPLENAIDFISNNEGYDRSFYTGFLGEIKRSSSEISLYVNLRCMQIKDSQAYIYVGGGVTEESLAAKELEETVKKASIMSTIL